MNKIGISRSAGLVNKFADLAPISSEDRVGLLKLSSAPRSFEANSYLVREGDNPNHCSVLVSGYACRHKISGEGARQIVSIHGPGEIIDLQQLYLETADHNVQTITRCDVVIISRKALRDLAARCPTVADAIFAALLVELSVAREWMLNVGRRDASTRVAHLLCELTVRFARPGSAAGQAYELPMTHEQLGDALALTAVHLSRTLKILARGGLIVRNKRKVAIPSWELLVRAADFNSRYLHLQII